MCISKYMNYHYDIRWNGVSRQHPYLLWLQVGSLFMRTFLQMAEIHRRDLIYSQTWNETAIFCVVYYYMQNVGCVTQPLQWFSPTTRTYVHTYIVGNTTHLNYSSVHFEVLLFMEMLHGIYSLLSCFLSFHSFWLIQVVKYIAVNLGYIVTSTCLSVWLVTSMYCRGIVLVGLFEN